jgi:hypothetical protein
MIAKMRDDGHSAKRRKWTKVLALVVGVALADASFVSVHAQEARNYLIHRDWFYWPTDPSEMTFRKYLPVEGGYKNIINLHCPRSRRGDMFTTIDLTSVPETSKFISELRDGKTQLMFKEGNDNIGIPLRSFIQATYEVGRIGTQYGFDRILTGGQDLTFERTQMARWQCKSHLMMILESN